MSRRLFSILLVTVFCFGIAVSQQIPQLVARQGYADLIVLSGKIVTMDDRSIVPNSQGNVVEAMAVKGKRIMALGTNDEMRRLAGPETRFVDVGSRTVIPGLINPHYHLFGAATRRYGTQFGFVDPSVKLTVIGDTTVEGTAKKIRDAVVNAIQVQNIPEGEWITVYLRDAADNRPATNRTWLYRGRLNRRQLDDATPDHPVIIRGRASGIFNSAAITEFMKVYPDWEESTNIENRPGSDQDGYIAVPEMGALTWEYWWSDKPLADLAEALRLGGLDILKEGMTTVGTRILYPRAIAGYNMLNRQGRMPLRLAYYIESQRGNFFSLDTVHTFYKGTGAPWTNHANGGEMLWLNGMCNEIWDSTQNEICMGPDLPAAPEIKARERCPGPGTRPWETYREAIVHGWRPVQAHGTSSHGARLYIKMLEQAMKEGNHSLEYMRGLRTTLEHNFLLGNVPDVMEGLKKFGVILNVKMRHLAEAPPLIEDYGEELRSFAMPVKTWINQGIRLTLESEGSDSWTPLYSLVTRKMPKSYFLDTEPDPDAPEFEILPEEAIDRVTALKMSTTWASEYVMAEDTLGSLEVGKFADFAVLDRDYFTIPADDIRNVEAIMTGLNGEIVWDREGIANP